MFAVPEMLNLVTREAISEIAVGKKGNNLKKLLRGVRMVLRYRLTTFRGSLVGVFVGLLPAAGATLASLLSYSFAKRGARKDQCFGEGEPEGVVAAESANNASEGGSMACLLALGIPGSAATAVILGGFMLHGLVPGPGLFRDNSPLVYGLIIGNLLQMCLLGFFRPACRFLCCPCGSRSDPDTAAGIDCDRFNGSIQLSQPVFRCVCSFRIRHDRILLQAL